MLSLIIWWAVGVALRFLFVWAFDSTFNLSQSSKNAVVSVAIGALAAYVASKANLTHWIVFTAFVCAGFLTKYIVEKLNKIKG